MIDIESLSKHVNALVELAFTDGHVVQARLIHVEFDAPQEIIHEVVDVVQTGPQELSKVTRGTVAAANPGLLSRFRPV